MVRPRTWDWFKHGSLNMPSNYRRKKSSSYSQRPGALGGGKVMLGIIIGILVAVIYWQHMETTRKISRSHISQPAPPAHPNVNASKTPPHPAVPTQPHATPAKPEFDFYTVLPKMQVQPPSTGKNTNIAKPPAVNPIPPNINTANTLSNPAMARDTQAVTMTVPPLTTLVPTAQQTPATKSTPPSTVIQAPQPANTPPAGASASAENQTKQGYALQVASTKNFADADNLKAQLTMLGFDVSIQKYTINGQTWNRVYAGFYQSRDVAIKKQNVLKTNHVSSILVKIP